MAELTNEKQYEVVLERIEELEQQVHYPLSLKMD